MQTWVWSALGTFVSGAFLYLFTRVAKKADDKRDEMSRDLKTNTKLTERTAWAMESLDRHVGDQNGRIGKLEERVTRLEK